jgi:hypothetical protein
MDCPNGFTRTIKFTLGLLLALVSILICGIGVARLAYPWFDLPSVSYFEPAVRVNTWDVLVTSIIPMAIAFLCGYGAYRSLKAAAHEPSTNPDEQEFIVRYSAHGGIKNIVEKIAAGLNLCVFGLLSIFLVAGFTIPLVTGHWFDMHRTGIGFWAFGIIPVFIAWACYDGMIGHKLVLSKRGIDIDRRGPASALVFGFQWFLPWDDLHSVTILKKRREKETNKSRLKGKLAMDFGSGASRYLELASLSKEELDFLFQAFERWSDKLALSPDVLALKDYVLLGEETARHAHEEERTSFTEIWEQSLNSRHASTAYMPLTPGQKLQDGRVSVISQVCSSGLSAVYLAEDKQKQRVILKECFVTPDTNQTKRAKAEELFKREASFLARLSHPQVAKLLDVFEENGRSYIVMQHISGTNLRQLVSLKGPQPEPVILAWAKQILGVLEYLHQQDPPIIHRDLTPDNMVLSSTGDKITVVDFGAANEFLGKATGTLIGKQCYIAPEQFRGKAQIHSDIYALGATMHFLLTGQDPEPLEASRPADVNDKVSLEISGLVEWCTNQEAELRPLSAADVKSAIDDLIQRQQTAAQPGESETVAIGLKHILRIRTRQES